MKIIACLGFLLGMNVFATDISAPAIDKSILKLVGDSYSKMSNQEKEWAQKQVISIANANSPEEFLDIKQRMSSLIDIVDSSKQYFEKNNCKEFFNGYARVSLDKKSLKTKITCKKTSINSLKRLKHLQDGANDFYGSLLGQLSEQHTEHEMINDLKIKLNELSALEKLLKNNKFTEAGKILTELEKLVGV